MANAVKTIAKYIQKYPESPDSDILRKLCNALEEKAPYELEALFSLKTKTFDMAVQLLDEWRFDRHVASRRLQKYLEQNGED
jgi:hypothetical protein